MTATNWSGPEGNVTNRFTITTSDHGNTGIDAWFNEWDPYYNPNQLWEVYRTGEEFYLDYKFSNLNYSPVPEPSTYFMTGALFCLIGSNRASRNAMIKFFRPLYCKLFGKQKQLPKSEKEIS